LSDGQIENEENVMEIVKEIREFPRNKLCEDCGAKGLLLICKN